MKVVIVGGGKPVYFLCRTFLAKGHRVTLINRDAESCVAMARRLKATVVHGDGSDPRVLEEGGAHAADAVLAVTPRDPDNLAVCQLAAKQFQVPRTVAIVNDPDNELVFRQLGVRAFSSTKILASLIEQHTALDDITGLIPAGEGKVNITEIRLSPNSPIAGKALRETVLPADSLIAVVMRDGNPIIPRGETVLHASDRVVLVTLPANHGAAIRAVTGEEK
jgi:trk system potassium uptake protein TrkA